MITSKSGKVIYLCHVCHNGDIVRVLGDGTKKLFACGVCERWFPWSRRLKLSVKRGGDLVTDASIPHGHLLKIIRNAERHSAPGDTP